MSGPERIWAHPTERNPVNKAWQRGKWKDHDSGASGDAGYIHEDAVAEMIRQAVEQEREACAQVCEDWGIIGQVIASFIRARGNE